jgi:taurine--2-oxoglutarate transaminase
MSELNVVDTITKHNYGTWRPQKGWKPIHVVKAEGTCFFDAAGKRYLDISGQLMCANLGHQNQAVIDAICAQAKELCYIAPSHATTVRAKLTQKLLEVVPKSIEKFFYATSGTEANEGSRWRASRPASTRSSRDTAAITGRRRRRRR